MTDSFYASGPPAADPMPAAAPPISAADDRLVWIDLEMTGLKPDSDRIIEVALVVTDASLATIAEAPVWVAHQSDATLAGMDAWNQGTHGRSGLNDKVNGSTMDEATSKPATVPYVRPPAEASSFAPGMYM